ncbi:MAG: DUF1538 domain-containing protein [Burkholderiales bacterium]|nr:DUF1538 domain-containing protein [Burkholderiales bacterium]
MLALLRQRLPEVLRAIVPLLVLGCVLQVTIVHAPLALFLQFLAGSVIALAGMVLLLAGVDMGILPMGRFIGAELPKQRSLWLIGAVAFAMGFATTVAEPDVLILARQAASVSQGAFRALPLIYLIAAGVGLFAAVALLRVVHGFSMRRLLAIVYSLMLVLTLLAPEHFVPLAYDAGSVTTGVLTTPVLLALSLGLSAVLGGRSAIADGFGLLGLASVGPIVSVLLLGWLWQ